MMISFWTGLFLWIFVGFAIIFIGAWLTKKIGKNGSIGGLIGFFIGIGFVFLMILMAGRLYVVTGDAEFSDYLVYGEQHYTLQNDSIVTIQINRGNCMVINDWEKPVIVEFMKYGGYGFGGDTEWIDPTESKIFEEPKIFYFYEDGPPEEISVRGGDNSEEYIRLWLRNKRD